MAEAIRDTDPAVIERCRASKIRWTELQPADRAVYERVYSRLEEIGRAAIERTRGQAFELSLTSGFNLKSGVRGSLPKDLWIAVHHAHAALGMPQLYMIASSRGIEYGYAAAIHTSDFSSQDYKAKVRDLVPRLFNSFPNSRSELITRLSSQLKPSIWSFRLKTRLDPGGNDFPSFQELVAFLRSDKGKEWGAGAACRYVTAEDLEHTDLLKDFLGAIDLFAPLLNSVYVPQTDSEIVENDLIDEPVRADLLSSSLEGIMELYPRVKQTTAYGRHDQLWSLFEDIAENGLPRIPDVQNDPNLRIQWSVGQGNWARVPWIALLDERLATSIQSGMYIVLLFREDMSGVYLTLNQGVTEIADQHGHAEARKILHDRALNYAKEIPELADRNFHLASPDHSSNDWIDLKTDGVLAKDYESAAIAGKFYAKDAVPRDQELIDDCTALLRAQYKLAKPAPAQKKTWLIAPGANAEHWEEFYRSGLIAIGWDDIGPLDAFETQQQIEDKIVSVYSADRRPTNDARTCFDFANSVHEGDVIFAKRGRSLLIGQGVVTGPYIRDEGRSILKNTRSIRWETRGEWNLPEGISLPIKTLTDISENTELLKAIEKLRGAEPPPPPRPIEPFDLEKTLRDLFLTRDQFEAIRRVWNDKKNLILQGPPGVGKTFVAKRLAYALMGYEDNNRVEMVQFHQSYSYEDFVQGYRPAAGTFCLKKGRFYSFCLRAAKDPSNIYAFIIDEINRGNLSKIFGELMLLIEVDKRGPRWSMPLAYAESEEDQFFVPENVYVVGMMNTADRSLSLVDYALRRRFAFITLRSLTGTQRFADFLLEKGVPQQVLSHIQARFGELNAFIADKARSGLGAGFCIGHSFFVPGDESEGNGAAWYNQTIETQIVPLLEEYWFDNDDLVSEWRSKLLIGT